MSFPGVRRSFLYGEDKFTGQSNEHRRAWVEDLLLFLFSAFSIGICTYAVMSNHIHVVRCGQRLRSELVDGRSSKALA